jgi:hypothetical protein
MTYIDEVPQQQARQAGNVARSVRDHASAAQVNIIDNLLDRNVVISPTQATVSLRLFSQLIVRMYQEQRTVTLTDMIANLEDAVSNTIDNEAQETTTQAKAKAVPKPKSTSSRSPNTANMAISNSPSATTAMSKLRTVDIYTSEGIWATLDEGCNATCHGEYWMRNAEAKLISG